MPYRLSGNDDDDEHNDDHGANLLQANFSSTTRSKQDQTLRGSVSRILPRLPKIPTKNLNVFKRDHSV